MRTKLDQLKAAALTAVETAPRGMSYEDAERYGPQAVDALLGSLEEWQKSLVRRTFMHVYLDRERARMKKDRALREARQR